MFQPMRLLVAATLLACALAAGPRPLAPTGQAPAPDAPLSLWFREPARKFYETCPLGNGRLGAMPFGGIEHEKIVLNEDTLWSGSVQDGDRAEARQALPELRRLLLAGRNREAQDLLSTSFICAGAGSNEGEAGDQVPYGCYQMLGLLDLDFGARGPVQAYRRELDLDAATARVSYVQDGVTYTRELFISAPAQALVLHLTCSVPGRLDFSARLSRPARAEALPFGGDGLQLAGHMASGRKEVQGLAFGAWLRCRPEGGTLEQGPRGLRVQGATGATLVLCAGTGRSDPAFPRGCLAQLQAAVDQPLAVLRENHLREFRSFFRRVALHLGEGDGPALPTPERLAAALAHPDPQLAALYFQFGRYLLISSSRPDSPLPANLQGLWAEELQTPWNGDYHLNINLQMNYWPAEVANLGDCHLPLMRYVESLVAPGRKTAQAYYGARGWTAHTITNPWGFTSPGEGAGWGSTLSCGPWLAQHLWQHYAYDPDRAFLAWAYPILKESAEFCLDTLVEEPVHHWLVTAPSNSPENAFRLPEGGEASTCLGPTMDLQIYREALTHAAQAAGILGRDPDLAAAFLAARDRLAPHQIGSHGQLQEWLADYAETDPHHRHVSHLYGLFPGEQIRVDTTPELARAARTTLERRGDLATGWSIAWKASLWAHLGDGDHAEKLLGDLFRPIKATGFDYGGGGGTYPNLFCGHPPFQIDGNFGGCAAIAELLLQSHEDGLFLLPALPGRWAQGTVTGLRARGGAEVDLEWRQGRLVKATLRSARGGTFQVHYRGEVKQAVLPAGGVWTW